MHHCLKHGTIVVWVYFCVTFTIVVTDRSRRSSSNQKSSTDEFHYNTMSKVVDGTDRISTLSPHITKFQQSTAAFSNTTQNTLEEQNHEDGRRTRKKKKDRNKPKKDRSSKKIEECRERSEMDLKEMLGPAFNGRYMSIEEPLEKLPHIEQTTQSSGETMADGSSANTVRVVPFHVDANYRRELPHDFYLDISWYQEVVQSLSSSAAELLRYARNIAMESNSLPWQCESEIIWTDLGSNYYPRFLRNVKCTRENCWFGHFKCRPKAFTVNVLKRARDSCKDVEAGQQWVYEERAVTFCCECVEH